MRRRLDLIMAKIEYKAFQFADEFSNSRRKEYFSALEGRAFKKDPRDYKERLKSVTVILRTHLQG